MKSQVKSKLNRPVQPGQERNVKKKAKHRGHIKVVESKPSQGPVFSKVVLQIHKVRCVEQSNELFTADDINIFSVKSEGEVKVINGKKQLVGKARKGNSFAVGKFRANDIKEYKQPKILAEFNLGAKDSWLPQEFVATMCMWEADQNHVGAVINEVVDAVGKKTAKAITDAATNLAAGALAGFVAGTGLPVVGNAVGTIVGLASSAALNCLKKSKEDDIISVIPARLSLAAYPTHNGEIEGTRKKAVFKGYGAVYNVIWSWAIVK